MAKRGPRATKAQWKEWWRLTNDEGMTAPQVARKYKLDTRTVKRGIRQLGAAGDDHQVRIELKKDGLAKHMKELLAFVGKARKLADRETVPDLTPLRAVFQPKGKWLRPPDMKLTWQADRSVSAMLSVEDTLEWAMLRSHVKTASLWAAIEGWKRSAEKLAGVERSTAEGIIGWLEKVTGLTALAGDSPEPHASLSGADELYARALSDAATGDHRLGNSEELVKLDGPVIMVASHALVVGLEDAASADAMMKKLRSEMRTLPAKLKVDRLSAALKEYRAAAGEVATELGYLLASHYLAGTCRGCKVLAT